MIQTQPSARALLPLLVFLALFIGTGTWLTLQGVEFAFYQLPAPVAALPAVMLALVLGKEGFNKNLETFFKGSVTATSWRCASSICWRVPSPRWPRPPAGGCHGRARPLPHPRLVPAAGAVPHLRLHRHRHGHLHGTIGAVAPVALGVAQAAGIDPVLMAGTILSGAMFGDNLSIISDTTIAATRSQGCEMKDKFRENFKIAAPCHRGDPALSDPGVGRGCPATEAHVELLKVMPYLLILVLALSGMNVFMVLGLGILAAAGSACWEITPRPVQQGHLSGLHRHAGDLPALHADRWPRRPDGAPGAGLDKRPHQRPHRPLHPSA